MASTRPRWWYCAGCGRAQRMPLVDRRGVWGSNACRKRFWRATVAAAAPPAPSPEAAAESAAAWFDTTGASELASAGAWGDELVASWRTPG